LKSDYPFKKLIIHLIFIDTPKEEINYIIYIILRPQNKGKTNFKRKFYTILLISWTKNNTTNQIIKDMANDFLQSEGITIRKNTLDD